ncbi:hypothetical protein N0V87_006224 [Didymella glomerata]|uniref:Major facilitator superfamily (MFS) profile domain-containing protein n=1 Tax=Didymella glomerata TaxID=749621 RepID=A0A9W8WX08_9PLEO|nr:hypothetical protein N0V87_006224 [Didymella glomerata]
MVTKYTISGVALVGPFESSVSTPAIEPTAAEFGSPVIIATLVFSTYHLGLAFGGHFAALLSESFGRRPVVFISLPIFALFILGADFARNIATLVVLRFFAGFFSAPSFTFFAAFPQVYFEYYGSDSLSMGLIFLGVGMGLIAATIVIILFSEKGYLSNVRKAVHDDEPAPPFATSRLEPEERLPLTVVGRPRTTIGLFI